MYIERICLQCRRPRFYSWVGKIPYRRDRLPTPVFLGFPGGSAGKKSTCNAGDLSLIPGLGRSPGEENGYPLQYSGLKNSMDCIICRFAKSQTRLSVFHFHFQLYGLLCFPGGSNDKQSACNAGDLGLIPGSGRSPGQGMAVHSSILAWRTPWTGEPGRLQSMGSQRVGHD